MIESLLALIGLGLKAGAASTAMLYSLATGQYLLSLAGLATPALKALTGIGLLGILLALAWLLINHLGSFGIIAVL